MSPRRSSTSSAERTPRSRYLGIEASGEPLPHSPAAWQALLRSALPAGPVPPIRFRLIRAARHRAIVEVQLPDLPRARAAWAPREGDAAAPSPIASRRTWGTLAGAKLWLAARPTGREA